MLLYYVCSSQTKSFYTEWTISNNEIRNSNISTDMTTCRTETLANNIG